MPSYHLYPDVSGEGLLSFILEVQKKGLSPMSSSAPGTSPHWPFMGPGDPSLKQCPTSWKVSYPMPPPVGPFSVLGAECGSSSSQQAPSPSCCSPGR